jgi:hypothetical protein
MGKIELDNLIIEQIEKYVTKFSEASISFQNTLLTINGLFLSLFTIFSDKFTGPKLVIQCLIILTAVSIIFILYISWLNKFGQEKILYMHTRSTHALNNPSNENNTNANHCNARDMNIINILSKPVKCMVNLSLISTCACVIIVVILFMSSY